MWLSSMIKLFMILFMYIMLRYKMTTYTLRKSTKIYGKVIALFWLFIIFEPIYISKLHVIYLPPIELVKL